MKKYILAPLCSGLVVPGLGQLLNGNLKKGLVLLFLVLALIIGCVLELFFMIQEIFSDPQVHDFHMNTLLAKFREGDFTLLAVLLVLFVLVWAYSVVDAWWVGMKVERQKESAEP